MAPEDIKKEKKQPYEKPCLRVIDLAAEEVLAVGCKANSGQKGFGNKANSCTFVRNCLAAGT